LAFHLKIPIVVLHQSINPPLRTSHFAVNNENNKVHFFIRPTKNQVNGEIIFHLYYCKNSFQFPIDVFESQDKEKMIDVKQTIEQGGYIHYRNYLTS
jgi:hypothetical protein